jgi:hypothetical protein
MTEILIQWREGLKVSAKRKAEIERLAHVTLLRDDSTPFVEMSIVTAQDDRDSTVNRAIHKLERFHEVQFAEVNQKYYAQ